MDHMAAKGTAKSSTKNTSKARRSGPDIVTVVYRLFRDAWIILQDGIWVLCRTLWRFNRGAARRLLPGQSRSIHKIVAALAVLLEVVLIWLALSQYFGTH
jgi:hypothetical protein